MTKSDLQSWLDRYILAWRANTTTAIEELFTDDAIYRFHPTTKVMRRWSAGTG